MSNMPEKPPESTDYDGPALMQTFGPEERPDDRTQKASMVRLTRKAQLSAYFTIAAAAFGLIR